MPLPIDLILVRHGESEGNQAHRVARRGDLTAFTEDFRDRHNGTWRLTEVGRDQAAAAGRWLRGASGVTPERWLVSPFHRAIETAALLDLPAAQWEILVELRERCWGTMTSVPHAERNVAFADALRQRETQAFFWTAPNGEALADAADRIGQVLERLGRERLASGKHPEAVVAVCHGEVMTAFRAHLEPTMLARMLRSASSDDAFDVIPNCGCLHYTRRNPETGRVAARYGWWRVANPIAPGQPVTDWAPVGQPTYTSAALNALLRAAPAEVA